MKYAVLTLFFLAVGISVIAFNRLSATPPVALGTQRAGDNVFEFGSRAPGELVEHTFYIDNDESQPLHIKHVSSSCGCTVAETIPSVIPGKSRAAIPVKIKLPQEERPFSSRVILLAEDGRRFALSARGQIIAPYPEKIDFHSVRRDSSQQRTFRVRPAEGAAVKEITSRDSFCVVELVSVTAQGDTIVNVRLAPEVPFGAFSSKLTATYENGHQITIPVTGNVLKPIHLPAEHIALRWIDDDQATGVIKLSTPYGGSFVIQEVRTQSSFDIDWDRSGDASNDINSIEVNVQLRGLSSHTVVKCLADVVVHHDGENHIIPVTLYALKSASATR